MVGGVPEWVWWSSAWAWPGWSYAGPSPRAAINQIDQRKRWGGARPLPGKLGAPPPVLVEWRTEHPAPCRPAPAALIGVARVVLGTWGGSATPIGQRILPNCHVAELSNRDVAELSNRDAAQLSNRDAAQLSNRDGRHVPTVICLAEGGVRGLGRFATRIGQKILPTATLPNYPTARPLGACRDAAQSNRRANQLGCEPFLHRGTRCCGAVDEYRNPHLAVCRTYRFVQRF
jgi:hypothetical protein